mgnify:CR=1 FL=1
MIAQVQSENAGDNVGDEHQLGIGLVSTAKHRINRMVNYYHFSRQSKAAGGLGGDPLEGEDGLLIRAIPG